MKVYVIFVVNFYTGEYDYVKITRDEEEARNYEYCPDHHVVVEHV